jgi:hypothetical protein
MNWPKISLTTSTNTENILSDAVFSLEDSLAGGGEIRHLPSPPVEKSTQNLPSPLAGENIPHFPSPLVGEGKGEGETNRKHPVAAGFRLRPSQERIGI